MPDMNELASVLDALLAKTDKSKVTADGAGFEPWKDGYVLCEVTDKTGLTGTKDDGTPMVSLVLKTLEEELVNSIDEAGNVTLVADPEISKGRSIYKNYVLRSEKDVKTMISDMLKFELPDEPGKPILDSEEGGEDYFATTELLVEALGCIVGSRIYVKVVKNSKEDPNTKEKKDFTNFYLVKWDRCEELGLTTK